MTHNTQQVHSPSRSASSDEPRGRRPSAIYNSFQDILKVGGKNSINNFASSYSRATNFLNADFDVSQHHRPKTLSYGNIYNEESALLSSSPSPNNYSTPEYDNITSNIESAILESEEADETRSVRSFVLRNVGNSTAPQTIFNGINTLVGIGILSLPLGLCYSGWIFGTIILVSCALSTQFTAKLLAKCMVNENLKTYGDISNFTFGKIAYAIVVSTFTIDLLSAGISMIIIFADSFNAITGIDKFIFKVIISILFFLSSFVRLDVLSHLSLIGIICTTLIVLTVLFCGFMKKEAPGSLIDISPTSLWPSDLTSLFLSVGIFMSPFGGHAIFPELYKDMKTPSKYDKSCTTIFSFTLTIDYIMASLGYLMFGATISDQITKSIMTNPGFPQWIQVVICCFMGILPVSKGPLITRPIITMVDQYTFDKFLSVELTDNKDQSKESWIRFINRFVIITIFFITSLVFTDFGKIMSFLGSAICFSICVIYPLAFYLKIFYNELSLLKKCAYFFAIFVAFVFAVSGTVAVVVSSV